MAIAPISQRSPFSFDDDALFFFAPFVALVSIPKLAVAPDFIVRRRLDFSGRWRPVFAAPAR